MTEEESEYSKKLVRCKRSQETYDKAPLMLENMPRAKYRRGIGIDYDLYVKKRVNIQKDDIHAVYAIVAPNDSEEKEVKPIIQEDACGS